MKGCFSPLFLLLLASASYATAFVNSVSGTKQPASTSLLMHGSDVAESSGSVDRRAFATSLSTMTATFFLGSAASPAFALGYGGEYKPKFDDLKLIYGLGNSLDNLASKISNPDNFESVLVSLIQFNKEPNFYSVYAKNYISKSVKNNAEGDTRVGYVKKASSLITSCQELLEGGEGLEGKAAADEAVKRVRKAQDFIGEFLAKSGVEDERVTSFSGAHHL